MWPDNERNSQPAASETSEPSSSSERFKGQARQRHNSSNSISMIRITGLLLIALACVTVLGQPVEARVTFEKMTNRDYSGITYYSIQNVSLFECLGWCKEESSCTSAVFSFVVNPFAALQETTCQLQNETQARQTAYLRSMPGGEQATVVASPQKATNLYFFNKIELPTESVCSRLWAFERFPNRRLRQRDRQPFHAPSKEACQAACMSESRFVCRSLEFNYISQQCTLNGYDRRSPLIIHLANQVAGNHQQQQQQQHSTPYDLIDAPGTDYFENACLLGEDICTESRIYDYAKIGLPLNRVAHFVELNYYPDKEMLVKSQAGCVRACTIEHEFICRSILYRSSFKQGQPNCALYHLDQRTFPEGADTFMSHVMQPLLDSGETSAIYLEAICNDTIQLGGGGGGGSSPSGASASSVAATTISLPPSSITIMPSSTTPGSFQVHANNGGGGGGQNHSTRDDYLSASSTLSPLNGGGPTSIRLPTTFLPPGQTSIPQNIQISELPGGGGDSGRTPSRFTLSPAPSSGGGGGGGGQLRPPQQIQLPPSHITISPAPPHGNNIRDETNLQITASGAGQTNHDQNCDAHGFCYDVALKCTDTRMVVNVKTQKPFHGRIYALGRSETCNANIKNQNQFQLDMYLTGQECNTQSAHHNVVLTKADKVYHVRCTYETASRNVSFGMMPVKDMFEVDVNDRNQETISITASSDAPLPKISILTLDGKEASTVRIGDRLTFRIEIPDNTPYGIFARSCIAMAKDARSTFEIIDENGCPVDHTIFPNFLPVANGNALESNYEAFRFTESYGVIFQCNVKYCIGKCEPVNCGIGRDSVEAWGRKKRSVLGAGKEQQQQQQQQVGKQLGDDMTLSREIVVLDLKEKDPNGEPAAADSTAAASDQSSASIANGGAQKSALRAPSARQSADAAAAAAAAASGGQAQMSSADELDTRHCLSRQSIIVLFTSIGFFFVLYMCVVACFFARRDPKISPIKHQYH